jgi:mannose-6-phosphate isomerase-like protein (cupin superfamily)
MSLLGRAEDVPDVAVAMRTLGGAGLSTKQIFGRDLSLMVATRGPGYHSRPHVHECEQLNYVLSGEIWIFVEDSGTRLSAGDFFRVPRMQVHWAWNRGEEPCELLEAHAPGLDVGAEDPVDLLDEGEDPGVIARVPMIWASDDYVEQGEASLREQDEHAE